MVAHRERCARPEAVPRFKRLLESVSAVDEPQGLKLPETIRLDPKDRPILLAAIHGKAGYQLTRRRRGRAAKGQTSARQRLGEKRQALVHPVIYTGVVVGELLIAMRNAKLVQPPNEPTDTVQQIELILLAAVDVKCLQPAEIARLGSDRNHRVLPEPSGCFWASSSCRHQRSMEFPAPASARRTAGISGR